MIRIAYLIYQISDRHGKGLLSIFFFVSIIAAFLEFLLLVSLSGIVAFLGGQTDGAFPTHYVYLFSGLVICSFLFQITNVYIQAYTATKIGTDWSSKVFTRLMEANYSTLSALKGADVLNFTVTETTRFTDCVIMPMLLLCSRAAIAFTIIILLFYKFPVLSVGLFVILASIYAVIYITLKTKLQKNSKVVSDSLEDRNDIVLSSFFNLKDIKINKVLRSATVSEFIATGRAITRSQSLTYLFVHFPRYFIETTLLLVMVILFLIEIINYEFIIFAFAGFRLLPNIQAIYGAFATIQGARTSYEYTLKFFDKANINLHSQIENKKEVEKITSFGPTIDEIELHNLTFAYNKKEVFNSLNLILDFRTKPIMLLGPTGSGKSTVLDLICGFYPEHYQNLRINAKSYDVIDIHELQSSISYVSQNYFCRKVILSDYLKALGYNLNDPKAVEVFMDLSLQFLVEGGAVRDVVIEENFKNFSGGQRQRLAICFAILRHPKLLILDEATNALDEQTAHKILNSILAMKINLIIITHQPIIQNRFTVIDLAKFPNQQTEYPTNILEGNER